jgi:hypothetical protein
MWKKDVVVKFLGAIPVFSGRTEENHEKLRIAGLRAEI